MTRCAGCGMSLEAHWVGTARTPRRPQCETPASPLIPDPFFGVFKEVGPWRTQVAVQHPESPTFTKADAAGLLLDLRKFRAVEKVTA